MAPSRKRTRKTEASRARSAAFRWPPDATRRRRRPTARWSRRTSRIGRRSGACTRPATSAATTALRLLEKATALDPEHTGARYELAGAYGAEGQPAKAAKQLEEFRRLKSREVWKPGAAGPADATHLEDWISFANYLLGEKKPREA